MDNNLGLEMVEMQRVYFPFQLAEGREIKDPFPYAGEIGGYVAELKRNEPYYTLELSQVLSEREAIAQFKKLIVAFYWVALETQAGLQMQQELQTPSFPPDPIQAAKNMFGQITDRKADVIIDGGAPAIWPDNKQAVKVTGQPVGFTLSYDPSRIFEIMNEGMKLSNPDVVLENSKLKLAIDLYCLSHFRSSHFARFLVLWTALETAAPTLSLSDQATDLINKWIKEVRDEQSKFVRQNGSGREELDSIVGSLNYLKKQSHGMRTRQYVKAMLEFVGDSDAESISREAHDLYIVRGGLTHTGKYHELGDSLSRMDSIVSKTLKAAIRHAGATPI